MRRRHKLYINKDLLGKLLVLAIIIFIIFFVISVLSSLKEKALNQYENTSFSGSEFTTETQVKEKSKLSGIFSSWFKKVSNSTEPATTETEVFNGNAPVVILDSDTSAEAISGLLPENSEFRVDFVDVGQADFIVVECDGHYMTIDGGNVADSQFVYSYLESRDIEHIERVVVTHAHEDHCGGVSAILTKCSADYVYCPVKSYDTKAFKNVVSKAKEQNLEITIPEAGDNWMLGSAYVEVLGPVKSYDDPNNTSIVLRVEYGNTSYLFTGDAEEQAEKDILNAGENVKADVLKVGHHGSNTSTSYQWLREVDPEYAVISSNREEVPKYGHPHESTLSKLRDADVTVYRTDMQGTITCVSDGNTITFTTERNPDADTLQGSGAGGNH